MSAATLIVMIGEAEAALWHQAVESPDALDVYLDWLLTHDPIRGELLRKHMQHLELTDAERAQEQQAWLQALGLAEVSVHCKPLPRGLSLNADHIAAIEPVLDQFSFLHVMLDFANASSFEIPFASSAMSKVRSLSFNAMRREEENYQSDPYYYFGSSVLAALCASPNVTQLETLWISDDPGYEAAKLVAAVPFVGLRELRFDDAIYDHGAIAIASSPIIKRLRKLTLYRSEVGDAGALALAQAAQLHELTIRGHEIGPAAAEALRAMPSLKHLDLKR